MALQLTGLDFVGGSIENRCRFSVCRKKQVIPRNALPAQDFNLCLLWTGCFTFIIRWLACGRFTSICILYTSWETCATYATHLHKCIALYSRDQSHSIARETRVTSDRLITCIHHQTCRSSNMHISLTHYSNEGPRWSLKTGRFKVKIPVYRWHSIIICTNVSGANSSTAVLKEHATLSLHTGRPESDRFFNIAPCQHVNLGHTTPRPILSAVGKLSCGLLHRKKGGTGCTQKKSVPQHTEAAIAMIMTAGPWYDRLCRRWITARGRRWYQLLPRSTVKHRVCNDATYVRWGGNAKKKKKIPKN